VSPVRYELGFISQKTAFFIVTVMKTSNLTGTRANVYFNSWQQLLKDVHGITTLALHKNNE
jgi:hypothetical protein